MALSFSNSNRYFRGFSKLIGSDAPQNHDLEIDVHGFSHFLYGFAMICMETDQFQKGGN